jgi:hypothetical protein
LPELLRFRFAALSLPAHSAFRELDAPPRADSRRRKFNLDERAEKARRRFEAMLGDAREAVAEASQGLPTGTIEPREVLTASKALNRAGGFLEAVSITLPELGLELIAEFEIFAGEVEALSAATPRVEEQRATTGRRVTNDRRSWERRLSRERRRQHVQVMADRRTSSDRRTRSERRTGHAREIADRRFRSLATGSF